ncbi:Virginiamycin B lyase [Pseudocercospora fuligena]|uniref:Virginiamycin B lyase n=1 Tax=Pseudocercospora fuligena TaxID=685502 RepID=A0A8H6RRA0_9PEZI|nr:Virginiamycin B lyase [Pseudocercospora fuligena]
MFASSILTASLLLGSAFGEAEPISNPHLVAESFEHKERSLDERQTALPPNQGRFSFYAVNTPASGPCDLAYSPVDGNLYGEEQFINQLFQLNPRTGKVIEYPIPFATPVSNATFGTIPAPFGDRTKFSCAIRNGADGNIYASNGVNNQLVQLRLRDKRIRLFQNPTNPAGNLFPFNDLYTDSQGMWVTQTTGNILQYFSYAQQQFVTSLQRTIPTAGSLPLGVFVASDGVVYGCEVLGNKIFTFDKRTGALREYNLPKPLQAPSVVRAEKNGWVYFTLLFGNGMGRINMKSKAIELYPTNQNPGFGSVNTGPANDGRVYMSYFASVNALAGFDDQTKTYTYVPFPSSLAQFGFPGAVGAVPPYLNIAVNYKPGNALWFSTPTFNAIGRYSVPNRSKARRGEVEAEE